MAWLGFCAWSGPGPSAFLPRLERLQPRQTGAVSLGRFNLHTENDYQQQDGNRDRDKSSDDMDGVWGHPNATPRAISFMPAPTPVPRLIPA